MYKKLISILMFCSLAAHADKKPTCLEVKKQQNKLTFYHLKQEINKNSFFYAKVKVDNPSKNKIIAWQDVKSMPNHLLSVSNTEPKQYEIPDNAIHLYIIQSSKPLDLAEGFGMPSHILPAANNRKKSSITKRNAGNFIRVLPKETNKKNSELVSNTINICEFHL